MQHALNVDNSMAAIADLKAFRETFRIFPAIRWNYAKWLIYAQTRAMPSNEMHFRIESTCRGEWRQFARRMNQQNIDISMCAMCIIWFR